MSGASRIEWTGATWNPIRARLKEPLLSLMPAGTWGYHCERVSPGCQNCYACTMNGRTLPAWGTGLDYTRQSRDEVEIYLDEQELLKPLHWKKPRFVFPCSMTDMFAGFVPDQFILTMFQKMAQCPRHTFQILTKRPQRMRELLSSWWWRNLGKSPEMGGDLYAKLLPGCGFGTDRHFLPNVWIGVSAEDQQHADERIPLLLQTPAACHWISYEPALGPLLIKPQWFSADGAVGSHRGCIDWVVAGGESGHGARPCNTEWIRSAVGQCKAAGVPVFVKQLGAHVIQGGGRRRKKDRKGGDMHEWEHDLRVREMPRAGARA